jgi:diguanylate cyclase (GGDEF)-like protein
MYIASVLLAGAAFAALAMSRPLEAAPDWTVFAALSVLATLTQLFKALLKSRLQSDHGTTTYSLGLIVLFAGVFLLPPPLFVPFVIIPYLFDWIKERVTKRANLPKWYIQPFNISTHLIAGLSAHWLFTLLSPAALTATASIWGALIGASVYAIVNHTLIGLVLLLARGVPLRESGVFDPANLASDFIQLALGYIFAVLWRINPVLVAPALSPLVMIYRALSVPQLKQQAHTDAKTGLHNAGHFKELFAEELERAQRFERPLSVIMADLDLLRNINNTYGHLAGDVVLASVGQVIRDNVRQFDIAGRFGGEEFAIVLPETDVREALAFAERLRGAIAKAEFTAPATRQRLRATMSLGVAGYPDDGASLTELIHQADIAVYQAKLSGRNCIVCAAAVPHSIRFESLPVADRSETSYPAAHATGSAPASAGQAPPQASVPKQAAAPAHSQPAAAGPVFPLFVGAVFGLGLIATALISEISPPADPVSLALLACLAMLAEYFQISVYGINTVSASVAIAFAAALIAGAPGVAAVSAGIALVHGLRKRPPLYKAAFNWAAHVLAGSAPALGFYALRVSLQATNLPLLGVLVAITGLVYYLVETGLIASAIGLSQGERFTSVWREQFRWLAIHYLVLCALGMFLAVAHYALGLLGVVVFALPVLMMHYAQRQYVERTAAGEGELRRMNQELRQANRQIVSASRAIHRLNDELFITLSKIIDARDPYAAGHAAKVSDYAAAVGARLGLQRERLVPLRQAALLHDIGKLGIPERILQKPGSLTPDESTIVETHTLLGAEFLETCQGLRHLAPMVRCHHEWWNGQGYPGELKGDQIPLESRILAVCDAVEAMASDRPYQQAMSWNEIVVELRRCAGTQFDPAVVEEFIRMAEREGESYIVNSAREVAHRQDGGNGRRDRLSPLPGGSSLAVTT